MLAHLVCGPLAPGSDITLNAPRADSKPRGSLELVATFPRQCRFNHLFDDCAQAASVEVDLQRRGRAELERAVSVNRARLNAGWQVSDTHLAPVSKQT